jgi:hypothetical protein
MCRVCLVRTGIRFCIYFAIFVVLRKSDSSFKRCLNNAYEQGSRNTATRTQLSHTNQRVGDTAETYICCFVCSAVNEPGDRIVNSALFIITLQILGVLR